MNLIGRCPPSSDMLNWYSIFERMDYKPVADLFPDKESPLKIMDAGAYVGYASAYFAEQFPNSTILAIEPDNKNYEMLMKNHVANVYQTKGALWSCKKGLVMKRDYRDKKEWSYYCAIDESVGFPGDIVLGNTVLHYMHNMEWTDIDILKMDIEGGEYEVFKDTRFLEFVKVLAMEVHHDKGNPHDIFDALLQHDFHVQQAGEIIIATRGV